ncbi:MAG: glycosyltransferase family 9 protein [Bacteroidia bacterium]|nr:glycosyltransferase family 9 protein [Bacteroidia bacterium]MDW8014719.1 glycosyltransferase family 9 protein [Bacteroidia bacterium]
MAQKDKTVARVLVIQTAFLGDALLTLPLIRRLQEAFPSAEVHWLLRKGNEELFEQHPWKFRLWTWDKSWRDFLRLYRELSQLEWEGIIVVQRFFRMGLLGWLLKARWRIAYDKSPLSFLYTHAVPHEVREGVHETTRVLALLRPLGFSPTLPPPPWLFPSELPFFKKPYIVVAPASRWATKEAPLEYWARFLQQVPLTYHVYLTADASQWAKLEKLTAFHPKVENVAGKLSLREVAALVAGAERLYTVDSALTHFGSALNVPTTTIYCSTLPAFGFGPLAPGSEVVETPLPLACRPCGIHGRRTCPLSHFQCGHTLPLPQMREKYPLR